MARFLRALVALGLGATMSGAGPLADATLRDDGEGFRLMGRLVLRDGLYAVAEARYGRAFDARAKLDDRGAITTHIVHQEVEGRAPPIPGLDQISLEPPREQTTADLSLPGPQVSAGWLTGPRQPPPVAAGELRFEPPTGPEGTGIAPPAPGIGLETPRGIQEGTPRRRDERDLSPLEVTVDGVGAATLRTDFDQRQVQQRVMPPNLSQPFLLEVALGDASWRIRYDSGLESYGPDGPVEDGISEPVLAAWGRRDAKAVAETAFLQAVRDLLSSETPIAGRTALSVEGLRFAGKAARKKGKLYYLPGPPKPGALEVDVRRHDFLALPELVEDRGTRPATSAEVRLRTLGRGGVHLSATADSTGTARLALEDPTPGRLSMDVHSPRSSRLSVWAAWRWDRPEEAWLDSGRPTLPSLAAGVPEGKRLGLLLRRVLEAYSPDDGNFHGPNGSSGIEDALIQDVLAPALAKAGGAIPGGDPVALAALRAQVAEAQERLAEPGEGANWDVLDPRHAPSSGTSLKALSGGLEVARRELGQVQDETWTLGLATAGAKLATRLASEDAGPGAKLLEGGARELLDQLKARREGAVHRAVVMTKAGPREGRAFPEDEWGGRLYLALAFHAAAKAFPDGGFREAAAAEVKRLDTLTRPSQAFPEAWQGKALGTVARVLATLVEEYGATDLRDELSAVRAELWSSVSGGNKPDRLSDWIDAMQAWL